MYYRSIGQHKSCPDYTPTYTKTSLWLKKRKNNPKGNWTANLIHFPTHSLVKKHWKAAPLLLKFILWEHNPSSR